MMTSIKHLKEYVIANSKQVEVKVVTTYVKITRNEL